MVRKRQRFLFVGALLAAVGSAQRVHAALFLDLTDPLLVVTSSTSDQILTIDGTIYNSNTQQAVFQAPYEAYAGTLVDGAGDELTATPVNQPLTIPALGSVTVPLLTIDIPAGTPAGLYDMTLVQTATPYVSVNATVGGSPQQSNNSPLAVDVTVPEPVLGSSVLLAGALLSRRRRLLPV